MRVQTKLIIVNLSIVLILMASLTGLLIRQSEKIIFGKVQDLAVNSLQQLSHNLDQTIASYEDIAYAFYFNNKIYDTLTRSYPNNEASFSMYFDYLEPYLSSMISSKDTYRVRFFTTNPTFVFSNVKLLDSNMRSEEWYTQLMASHTGNYLSGTEEIGLSGSQMFSMRQRLNHQDPSSELSVAVDIREDVLSNLINEESKSKRIVVALPNHEILLDSEKKADETSFEQFPFFDRLQEGAQGQFMYTYRGVPYMVLYDTLNTRNMVNGINVVMMIPWDVLMKDVKQLQYVAVVFFLLAAILSGTLIYLISVRMTKQLRELSRKMRTVQEGYFQVSIKVKGKDEISHLGNAFNEMAEHLDRLVREVYQTESKRQELALRTKESELYALQAQIRPHFLFNVLNTIRANLLINGDKKNAEIVGYLAQSFRMMIDNREQTITLLEESKLVRMYLHIQQYRFEERLQFDIQIPENLKRIKIPKLSLQPLVENTIIHAMELKEGKTNISVVARQEDSYVYVTVVDDGGGIAPKRLAQIRHMLSSGSFPSSSESLRGHGGIGLINVHQRIKQMYGDDCGLSVESDLGRTKVTVVIRLGV